MSVERLVANLVRVAREDLDGARVLASAKNRNAIYLCEQAAEKLIRAVVSSEGKHAGIRHQLDEMVDLVPDENPLKPYLRDIEYLAAYATTYRYPTAAGRIKAAPGREDLVSAARSGVAASSGDRSLGRMADRATWTKRVRAWRASGKTADAFCAGRDFAPATLKWWSWRLKNKPARKAGPKRSKSRAIPLARVVRPPATVTLVSSAIAVELRRARVVVPAGADRATLEAVLEQLLGRRSPC